jgi:hypothetical protein
MESTIGFVGIATAVFVSFAVALGLEWVSLELLMKMMPARAPVKTMAQRFAASDGQRTDSEFADGGREQRAA